MRDLREVLEKRRGVLRISIDVGSYKDDVDLYDELMFTQDDLTQHIESQPALVSWWSVLHRRAELEHNQLERNYDIWYSTLYEKAFTKLRAESSSKPNISSVENTVKLENRKEYLEWQDKLEQKRIQVAILSDVVNWFKEKGQMLIQAAKFYQLEYDSTNMRVRGSKRGKSRAEYEEESKGSQERLKSMMSES